jgi:hypothetical protein
VHFLVLESASAVEDASASLSTAPRPSFFASWRTSVSAMSISLARESDISCGACPGTVPHR